MEFKRSKNKCEICGNANKKVLDKHHIIPVTDPKSTNLMSNLAIICSNCHRRVHAHEIIIEGVFATTDGSALFWHYSGDPHIITSGVILNKDGTATIGE